MEQSSLFFVANTPPPKETSQSKPKPTFTPPTVENGTDPHLVLDQAMLWLRTLAKQNKSAAPSFLFHQLSEIKFKRSEYDQVSTVRASLLKTLKL